MSALGVDATIVFGAARMGWVAAAGLLTIFFVARFLSGVEQGYFYTFFAFFQLQSAFQAGAYVALYSAISHAWARLGVDDAGRIVGAEADLAHLGGLLRLSRLWHIGCAALFALLLGPLGYLFFSRGGAFAVHWQGPWWLLSLAIASSFLILPDGLALEATGRTGVQQRGLFYGQLLSSLCVLVGLAAHAGLYIVGVSTILRLAVTGISFRRQSAAFRRLPASRIDWRAEILPQQGRVTVSWILGYVIFVSAVPITFRAAGPVVAGRLGVALQIYQAVSGTAAVWITQAQPRMGRLAATGAYRELHRLTRSTGLRGTASAAVLALASVVLVIALRAWLPSIAPRLPGYVALVLFLAAAIAGQTPAAMAAAVRLTRVEPFIPVTAASAALTLLLYTTLGKPYGEIGVAAGFLGVAVLLLYPGQVLIYRRHIAERPQDHRPATPPSLQDPYG